MPEKPTPGVCLGLRRLAQSGIPAVTQVNRRKNISTTPNYHNNHPVSFDIIPYPIDSCVFSLSIPIISIIFVSCLCSKSVLDITA